MKKDIHPKYQECSVKCGCGAEWKTRSVLKEVHLSICSSCHPFFTGKSKLVDAAGRIEKFQRRYGIKDGGATTIAAKVPAKGKKAEDKN